MSAPPIGRISSTPKASDKHDDDGKELPGLRARTPGRRPRRRAIAEQQEVEDVLVAVGDRPRRQHFLQLAGGHQAAGEGQVSEQHLDDDRDRPERRQLAVVQPQHVLRPCRPALPPGRRTHATAPFAAAPRSAAPRTAARRSTVPMTSATTIQV